MPFRIVSRETSTPFGAAFHSNRKQRRWRTAVGAGIGTPKHHSIPRPPLGAPCRAPTRPTCTMFHVKQSLFATSEAVFRVKHHVRDAWSSLSSGTRELRMPPVIVRDRGRGESPSPDRARYCGSRSRSRGHCSALPGFVLLSRDCCSSGAARTDLYPRAVASDNRPPWSPSPLPSSRYTGCTHPWDLHAQSGGASPPLRIRCLKRRCLT